MNSEKQITKEEKKLANAVKETNKVFEIFVNKDRNNPYPTYPYRRPSNGAFGIKVAATCGDAFVVATFGCRWKEQLEDIYPKCHRHPNYDCHPYSVEKTTKNEIPIKTLESRLKDIRELWAENPLLPFDSMVRYYDAAIPCVATAAQVGKLIATAKAVGEKTVTLYACTIVNHPSYTHAEVLFYVGPYIVGLIMPLTNKNW